MARKHKRRTRKRNKKGGFLGPSMSAKVDEGIKGWKDIGADVKAGAESGAQGMKQAASDVHSGYTSRVERGGLLPQPPQPPSSPPPMDPVKEKQFSLESTYKQSIETSQPTKEKQGGLLGLGTWFGLGGRRLSHSAFINKMLRVRSKTKRNKALRKYLKGGKKKTKKRKTKTKKRKGRKKKGGRNDTCIAYYQKKTLLDPALQSDDSLTEDEANNYCMSIGKSRCLHNRGVCIERIPLSTEALEADNQRRMNRLLADSGGRRKRKNKTKKRRRRR